jgi:metal-responsive CopG/Arc/MetJ family transcriptional regulator
VQDRITVRLPAPLARVLRRTARRLRCRPSEVVRIALETFLRERVPLGGNPPDRVAHLLGALSSEIDDLAERHRKYVLEAIKRSR